MKDLIIQFIKDIWSGLDYKKILLSFYKDHVRDALLKLVAKTDNPWDNYAVTCLDYVIEKLLGSNDKAEAAKAELKK